MASTIPVDAYLLTLRVVTRRLVERTVQSGHTSQTRRERVEDTSETPPGFTPDAVRALIAMGNRVWTPAAITFQLRNTYPRSAQAPSNTAGLTDDDFRALASRDFAARDGISALFVRSFSGADGGGGAMEPLRSCILCALRGPSGELLSQLLGSILAHEFGHLLHLSHEPVTEASIGNLMRPGARPPEATNLTPAQITVAQGSALARRFRT